MTYVLLTLVNPNKKNKLRPVNKFLFAVDPNDDDAFARLKTINGKGFYYEEQPAMLFDTEFGKTTKFYGEPSDSARLNLMWLAGMMGGYDGKWADAAQELKRHIGIKDFADITKATALGSVEAIEFITVITEMRK